VEQPKRVEAEKEAGGQTAERRRRSGWRGGKRQKRCKKRKRKGKEATIQLQSKQSHRKTRRSRPRNEEVGNERKPGGGGNWAVVI
jgi:hypothetical protein